MRHFGLPSSDYMVLQRHLCGFIGLLLFVLGAGLCVGQSANMVLASASLRAGALLMVTWLAWPTLIQWRGGLPRVALIAVSVMLVILVVRPSWGKVAAAATIAVVGGSLLSRWLSTLKHGRRDRTQ